MDRKGNIFWGAILIVVGILFLGANLDWFHLNWSFSDIARFWPLLLILAGVAAFLNNRRTIYNGTSALLIAFAIPLGIFTCVDDGVTNWKDEFDEEVHIDFDDDDDDDDHDYKSSKSDTTEGDRYKNYYAVEMKPEINEATLKLSGGAAEFDLEESKTRLFEATTYLQNKGSYTLTEDLNNGVKTIEFESKNKNGNNFHFDDEKNFDNDILVKLNKTPVWNIDLGIGAGEVDFDFSDYKVKKLELNTGAASIDIKFGDKVNDVQVDINSGVTSVKISVPEGVGCEIKMDGAFNSKDFDGFEKVKSGVWQTPGYAQATKKIKIDADTGLSSVKIVRY